MERVLIVPAAGRGTRLGTSQPKALVPVAGRPMLDRLIARHRPYVDACVVVVAPDALAAFRAFAAARAEALQFALQPSPTGMLDAILEARPFVAEHRPRRIAITWCDQIAISDATAARLRDRAMAPDAPALVFPTVEMDRPYIHFDRDAAGRIAAVRHRREGDAMPARGEADMGLFDLSLDAYLDELPAFGATTQPGGGTGERNFLPFIPWLAARRPVETFPARAAIEAIGINTPDDLAAVEASLARDEAARWA
jgi:CTP:molybdopterin cytidylyltransferase MocA